MGKINMPVDYLGCLIEEGDIVVYPVRRGSDMYLKRMKVYAVQTIRTVQGPVYKLKGTNESGRLVTVENLDRTIVVG